MFSLECGFKLHFIQYYGPKVWNNLIQTNYSKIAGWYLIICTVFWIRFENHTLSMPGLFLSLFWFKQFVKLSASSFSLCHAGIFWEVQATCIQESFIADSRYDVGRCRNNAYTEGSRMAQGLPGECLAFCNTGTCSLTAYSSFRLHENGGQESWPYLASAGQALCLFLHLRQKLSHHSHHGFHGNRAASFPRSQAVSLGGLPGNRSGAFSFRHKIFPESLKYLRFYHLPV